MPIVLAVFFELWAAAVLSLAHKGIGRYRATVDKAINAIESQQTSRVGPPALFVLGFMCASDQFVLPQGRRYPRPAETTARPEKTLVKETETKWLKTYLWRTSKPF